MEPLVHFILNLQSLEISCIQANFRPMDKFSVGSGVSNLALWILEKVGTIWRWDGSSYGHPSNSAKRFLGKYVFCPTVSSVYHFSHSHLFEQGSLKDDVIKSSAALLRRPISSINVLDLVLACFFACFPVFRPGVPAQLRTAARRSARHKASVMSLREPAALR